MQAVLERIEWNQNKMRLALLWPPPYLPRSLFIFFSLSLSHPLLLVPPTTNTRLAEMRQHVTSFGWLGCILYIYIYVKERRRRARLLQYRHRNPEPSPAGPSSSVCVAPISIVKVMLYCSCCCCVFTIVAGGQRPPLLPLVFNVLLLLFLPGG